MKTHLYKNGVVNENVTTDMWNIIVQYLQLIQLWKTFLIETKTLNNSAPCEWIRNNWTEGPDVTTQFYSSNLKEDMAYHLPKF